MRRAPYVEPTAEEREFSAACYRDLLRRRQEMEERETARQAKAAAMSQIAVARSANEWDDLSPSQEIAT